MHHVKVVLCKSLTGLLGYKISPRENKKTFQKIKTLKNAFFIKIIKNIKKRFLHLCFQPPVPIAGSNRCFQLLLPTTGSNHFFQPLLPTISSNHFFQPLLPTISSNHFFQPLLPTTSSNHFFQLLLQTTGWAD